MAEYAGLPIAGIIKRHNAAIFRAISQPDSKIDMHFKMVSFLLTMEPTL